jgi:hypothetical protein
MKLLQKISGRFVKPESMDQAAEMLENLGCKVDTVTGREAIVASLEAVAKVALSPGQKVVSIELPGSGRALLVLSAELGCLPD